MEKSKVVLISENKDWANIGAMFALCLNSVGVSARSFTKNAINNKPFIHSEIFGDNIKLLEDAITDETEAIIWMHSIKMKLSVDLSSKKECVFHGGSHYRRSFKSINVGFKDAYAVFIQTAELLSLCDRKDKVWLLPAAYVGDIKPIIPLQGKEYVSDIEPIIHSDEYEIVKKRVAGKLIDVSVKVGKKTKKINHNPGNKLIIGHFPSNGTGLSGTKGDIKGTIGINNVMSRFKDIVDWRFIDVKIPWHDNLKRVNGCDVYIESLNYSSTSLNKHDWSIAALEAAALGKIVITNFVYGRGMYESAYGPHKLQVANTEEELEEAIIRLLSMSDDELVQLKQDTLDWVTKAHSLKAIGNRIKNGLGL